MSFEGVDFDVVDVAFDFAFVLWGVGACWNDGGVIVFCESEDLGVEFRIVPISLFDGGFEVINTQRGGDSTEVPEGVLNGG